MSRGADDGPGPGPVGVAREASLRAEADVSSAAPATGRGGEAASGARGAGPCATSGGSRPAGLDRSASGPPPLAPVPRAKRALDLALAVPAAVAALPVLTLLLPAMWATQGRPILYVSERMRAPGRPFRLLKLRTMRPAVADTGVSGGDKTARVTPVGRFLRRWRLDEIPQIINVLRGDMSVVGPRPPLRQYTEAFPGLYAEVLAMPPGVTGLATLIYHAHEERLLARSGSAEETHAIYARACVPRKARLDVLYRDRWSPRLDLWILGRTLLALAGRRSRRARR